jgi:hypothetical protein
MSRDQELTVAGRHMDDTVADLPLNGSVREMDGYDAPAGDVDLSADPFDDNLADELAARQPVRLTSRTMLALGGAVLIIGGFLGGVLVQKNVGTASTSGLAAGAANAANGRGGLGGAGGGGQAPTGQAGAGTGTGNATTGTVKVVDGTTIYLTTASGQVITVKTSSSTTVGVQQSGTLKDLPAGATVTVQGTADADGVITATQVTSQK